MTAPSFVPEDLPALYRRVRQARERIAAHVVRTPLEASPWLSDLGRCQAALKLECCQQSGSFKLRGALNKFLSLQPEQRRRPVVAASSGNHAAAVGTVLQRFDAQGIIYLPRTVAPAKEAALRPLPVERRKVGDDCVQSEIAARAHAAADGLAFIAPYNDMAVIAGQGTVGLEIAEQMPEVDTVLVPVGGGGLIAGIAALKAAYPHVHIIGCQPQASAVMQASVAAGRIVELPSGPTLADGTAGGIEPGSVTLPICRHLVDDFLLVTEEQIAAAIVALLRRHQLLVEGAAALAVAAFCSQPHRFAGRRVVLVLTGRRIDPATVGRLLAHDAGATP